MSKAKTAAEPVERVSRSVRLDPGDNTFLKVYAAHRGHKVNDLIIDAVKAWIKQHRRDPK